MSENNFNGMNMENLSFPHFLYNQDSNPGRVVSAYFLNYIKLGDKDAYILYLRGVQEISSPEFTEEQHFKILSEGEYTLDELDYKILEYVRKSYPNTTIRTVFIINKTLQQMAKEIKDHGYVFNFKTLVMDKKTCSSTLLDDIGAFDSRDYGHIIELEYVTKSGERGIDLYDQSVSPIISTLNTYMCISSQHSYQCTIDVEIKAESKHNYSGK